MQAVLPKTQLARAKHKSPNPSVLLAMDTSAIDSSLLNRAAPPGSLRYFALLYTPAEQRDAIAALFVIDNELRESAIGANHDVAHTRLQWWRAEIDRLVNADPQHPATRLIHSRHHGGRSSLTKLHEIVAAADMDLARMTYLNQQELRAYCARSSGALLELMAAQLSTSLEENESARSAITKLGIGIRQTEIVRDLRQDAHDGRVYLPLDEMERLAIAHEQLNERETSPSVRELLKVLQQDAREHLSKPAVNEPLREALRPIWVLTALHRRLLDRIAARNYDVAPERIELGPLEKPWVAWRAARRGI
jgi:15-cis-phytoene synthase